MGKSKYFHRVILSYLTFIFIVLNVGCGYKTKPFYEKNHTKDTSTLQTQEVTQKDKKTLFQAIDSKPTPSYEEYE